MLSAGIIREFDLRRFNRRRRGGDDGETNATSSSRIYTGFSRSPDPAKQNNHSTIYNSAFHVTSSRWTRLRGHWHRLRLSQRRGSSSRWNERYQQDSLWLVWWLHVRERGLSLYPPDKSIVWTRSREVSARHWFLEWVSEEMPHESEIRPGTNSDNILYSYD